MMAQSNDDVILAVSTMADPTEGDVEAAMAVVLTAGSTGTDGVRRPLIRFEGPDVR